MPEVFNPIAEQLTRHGIRPSYHRIQIFAYLSESESHPSVEDIFTALAPHIPTLSKATVYNTLHTLIEAGLVREVNIDLDAQRYDTLLGNHGHFRCDSCGQITDFEVDLEQIPVNGLNTFQVDKKDIYFTGLCPACQPLPESQ
ncbi:MAG: Fur family transcriptional regulator [Brevefilum sp.]